GRRSFISVCTRPSPNTGPRHSNLDSSALDGKAAPHRPAHHFRLSMSMCSSADPFVQRALQNAMQHNPMAQQLNSIARSPTRDIFLRGNCVILRPIPAPAASADYPELDSANQRGNLCLTPRSAQPVALTSACKPSTVCLSLSPAHLALPVAPTCNSAKALQED